MPTTKGERRATRWLATVATDPSAMSAQARQLLVRRLTDQRRAARPVAPLAALAMLAMLFSLPWLGRSGWAGRFAASALISIGLLVCWMIATTVLIRRADRRLAASLTERVSRASHAPLTVILGRTRTAYAITAICLHAVVAGCLIAAGLGWLDWAYLAGYLASCAFAGWAIRTAIRRPAIAIDPASLAVDERLRSIEAFAGLAPLSMLYLVLPAALMLDREPAWLATSWFACSAILICLNLYAQVRPPWSGPSRRGQVRSAGSQVPEASR